MNFIIIVFDRKGRKYFRLFAFHGTNRKKAIHQAKKEFKQDFGVKGKIVEGRI